MPRWLRRPPLVGALVTAVAEDLGGRARQRFEQFGSVVDHWIRPWPVTEAPGRR